MPKVPSFLSSIQHIRGVRADFVSRISGIEVDCDRDEACKRLQPAHSEVCERLGFNWSDLHFAEQVHGSEVATVLKNGSHLHLGADGLIATESGVLLGIYVADCGAIYVVDPNKRAIALLHSGKKGTEQNILGKAIGRMQEQFGSDPSDLLVALSPCIRPPLYEVDFAAQIRSQALEVGVLEKNYTASGVCTGLGVQTYYSYRVEKGKTGRMLALLGMV